VQIEQLLKALAQKCRELEALKGNPEKLQQTLAFMEELTKKVQRTKAATPEDAPSNKTKPCDDQTSKLTQQNRIDPSGR